MSLVPKRLLVIDYDFFFPTPSFGQPGWEFYDWGHSENIPFYFDGIWPIRAATFMSRDMPLPEVQGTEGFWKRFRFKRTTMLHISDSNVFSYDPDRFRGVGHITLFDAHHDAGYKWADEEPADRVKHLIEEDRITCEDWMVPYGLAGVTLEHRYPTWRINAFDEEPEPMVDVHRTFDDGLPVPGTYDFVSICRSSAWVPPWCDAQFDTFCQQSGLLRRVVSPLYERSWDTDVATKMSEVFAAGS